MCRSLRVVALAWLVAAAPVAATVCEARCVRSEGARHVGAGHVGEEAGRGQALCHEDPARSPAGPIGPGDASGCDHDHHVITDRSARAVKSSDFHTAAVSCAVHGGSPSDAVVFPASDRVTMASLLHRPAGAPLNVPLRI